MTEPTGPSGEAVSRIDQLPTEPVAGPVPVEHAMVPLTDRAGEVTTAQDRLRLLLSANRAIVGELSLPMVLQRIVEVARDLLGPRYGAIGVIGPDGLLEQFIHLGMDADTVAAIGDLPDGKGVLGMLIDDPRPIRLSLFSDHARSSGFPFGHSPMEGFLGVPIRFRNEVFGNLYLTECASGAFTPADEELALGLAATAGVAIENAHLYEESRRRQLWLQASAGFQRASLFSDPESAVADRGASQTARGRRHRRADAHHRRPRDAAHCSGHRRRRSCAARCAHSGRRQCCRRSHGYRPRTAGRLDRRPVTIRSPCPRCVGRRGAGRPDVGQQRTSGRHRAPSPPGPATLLRQRVEMAEMFANYAGIAQELVTARADQQKVALLEDRDRIARDLHDHVIQGLFAAGLTIQSVAARSDPDLAQQLGRSVADINGTIRQIRTSIFQLTSTDTTEIGLRAAVLAVVRQVTPLLGFEPTIRFSGPVDTVIPAAIHHEIEAVVRESVTNAAKHARSTQLVVQLAVDSTTLSVAIADNGIGVGQPQRLSGLRNLNRRANQLGGTLRVAKREPTGTQILWTIPTA